MAQVEKRTEERLETMLAETRKERSYASVLRSSTTSTLSSNQSISWSVSNASPISSQLISPHGSVSGVEGKDALPGVNLDLTRMTMELDTDNITDVEKRVSATLGMHTEMKGVHLLGMVYTGKNAKKFRLLCQSVEDANIVQHCNQWVDTYFRGG